MKQCNNIQKWNALVKSEKVFRFAIYYYKIGTSKDSINVAIARLLIMVVIGENRCYVEDTQQIEGRLIEDTCALLFQKQCVITIDQLGGKKLMVQTKQLSEQMRVTNL